MPDEDEKVQAPEGSEQVQEGAPEAAALQAAVQEPSPEAGAELQEIEPQPSEIETVKVEVEQLRRQVQAKDAALSRATRQYQEMMANAARIEGKKQRAEYFQRLERARDDPEEAARIVEEQRAAIQRSDAEEDATTRAYGVAERNVINRAYNNPAFEALPPEEKLNVERAVLEQGGGSAEVIAAWSYLTQQRIGEQVQAAQAEKAALEQRLTALENTRAAEKLNGDEGPDGRITGQGPAGKLDAAAYRRKLDEGLSPDQIDALTAPYLKGAA